MGGGNGSPLVNSMSPQTLFPSCCLWFAKHSQINTVLTGNLKKETLNASRRWFAGLLIASLTPHASLTSEMCKSVTKSHYLALELGMSSQSHRVSASGRNREPFTLHIFSFSRRRDHTSKCLSNFHRHHQHLYSRMTIYILQNERDGVGRTFEM